MLNQIKKFMLDESGLETVEWAVVGGIIVIATAVTFGFVGDAVVANLDALILAM
ncbi:MAG: Flp family type IVb pilin [Deltaproteobacteria bacterium]|nr:Flp family type IVb pilin [Deltaproteobacteria bacterium]